MCSRHWQFGACVFLLRLDTDRYGSSWGRFSADRTGDYLRLSEHLRQAGLSVELFPDKRKLGAQMKYADRRGHRLAVIIGDSEWEAGTAQIKKLDTAESEEVAYEDVAARCHVLLSSGTSGSANLPAQ